jgi:4-carboxymuconolactone decarboxylase
VPAGGEAAYDAIVASRGSPRGPFKILMYSPELAARTADVGSTVMEGLTPPRDRLLLTVIAGIRELDCAYEWGAWSRASAAAGIPQSTIDAVGRRAPLESFSKEDGTLVAYAREVVRDHKVRQQTFDAALAVLGERGLVEVTGAMGYFAMISFTLNAFEIELLPDFAPLPPA